MAETILFDSPLDMITMSLKFPVTVQAYLPSCIVRVLVAASGTLCLGARDLLSTLLAVDDVGSSRSRSINTKARRGHVEVLCLIGVELLNLMNERLKVDLLGKIP